MKFKHKAEKCATDTESSYTVCDSEVTHVHVNVSEIFTFDRNSFTCWIMSDCQW